MTMKFYLLQPYVSMFIDGLAVTCEVTAAALVLALALGFVIAVLKVVPCRPLRAVLDFYTSIFRGVPLIVLLFMAYFATPQLTGYKISMFAAGVITLGLNGSATVSETVRGGIEGVDRGQYDAARAIGLSYGAMMRLIIIPQALRSVIPALVNEVITVLKSSSLVATRHRAALSPLAVRALPRARPLGLLSLPEQLRSRPLPRAGPLVRVPCDNAGTMPCAW